MIPDPFQVARRMIASARAQGWFRSPCRLCRGESCTAGPLCRPCASELPWLGWAEARSAHRLVTRPALPVIAAFAYRYPLDRIITRAKGGSDPRLVLWALQAAVEAIPDELGGRLRGLELCPVPTRPGRLRLRRTDLPQQLAARLRSRSGAPIAPPARWMAGADVAQHGSGSRERRTRSSGRFHLPGGLSGRRLVLVDDVCTTGATLAALAEAAEAAGALVEVALVLALTDPPGLPPAQTSRFTTERA